MAGVDWLVWPFFMLPPVWWPNWLLPFDNDVLNRLLFLCEVLGPLALLAWLIG